MTPREQAVSRLPEARKWVGAALAALNHVIGFSGKRSEIPNLPQFKALQTHFHVTLGPAPTALQALLRLLPFVQDDPTLVTLKEIRFRYFDLLKALSRPSIFLDSPAEGEGKDASAFVPTNRDGTIRITPNYLKVGPLNQVLVLVHEAVHFLGDEFQEWSYRDREGMPEPDRYDKLPVQFAIRNPDSYAYFAFEMKTGTKRILKIEE